MNIKLLDMLGKELSAGGKSNVGLIKNLQLEHQELEESIQERCKGCSSAWLLAFRGRAERLESCPGRSEDILGGLAVGTCHLPRFENTSSDLQE